MAPRVYALIWLLVVASAALFYVTGNLNDLVLTVFGFIAATLFAGFFLAVLPWWVDKIHEPKTYPEEQRNDVQSAVPRRKYLLKTVEAV